MPIDEDVEFMAIVELCVSGDIEAGEVRDRYNALLARRSRSKRGLGRSPESVRRCRNQLSFR
jgi:hypothetical protein